MAFDIKASAPSTITVSNSSELRQAYLELSARNDGGTIRVDGDGGPYSIYFRNMNGPQNTVKIVSADADNPAHFTRINIRETDNVKIDNVIVDSTNVKNRDLTRLDMEIYNSDGISITNSEFKSDAEGFITSYAARAGSLGSARWSNDFEFSGNTVSDYYHGLVVLEGRAIKISDNDISGMQGDGMRLGGVQNIKITGNDFHDFHGTSQNVTHSDMIQFWGSNARRLSKDVEISGNVFNTGDGAASQTIFIRNEKIGKGGTVGQRFQDFDISENIIYNAHPHGIQVSDVNGLHIANNTVLWNRDAVLVRTDKSELSKAPAIVVRNSIDAEVVNNIASRIVGLHGSDAEISGNRFIDYGDPMADNYVTKHFVNAHEGGPVDLRDLRLKPGSDWNNEAGAALTQAETSTSGGVEAVLLRGISGADQYKMTFDATKSLDTKGYVDPDEYEFVWAFSDGTSKTGASITKEVASAGDYDVTLKLFRDGRLVDEIDRDFSVRTKDIVSLEASSGLRDVSDRGARISETGNVDASSDFFRIGRYNEINVSSGIGALHYMDGFGLSLDMKLAKDEASGNFATLYRVFSASVRDDGRVWFGLKTDEGFFAMISKKAIFGDGDWHKIGISYDDSRGIMEMFADGERVASSSASGITIKPNHDLIFGNIFSRKVVDSYIDNIEMSTDPSIGSDTTGSSVSYINNSANKALAASKKIQAAEIQTDQQMLTEPVFSEVPGQTSPAGTPVSANKDIPVSQQDSVLETITYQEQDTFIF